jgi:hypothetical protein
LAALITFLFTATAATWHHDAPQPGYCRTNTRTKEVSPVCVFQCHLYSPIEYFLFRKNSLVSLLLAFSLKPTPNPEIGKT